MPEGQQPRGGTPCPRSGRQLGGATLRLRPGAAAGRSNPTSKEQWLHGRRRAWKSHPEPQGQGQQLGGATYTLGQVRQPGGATRGVVAAQAQEGLEELSHIEGQEWCGKEIPLVQGKEQQLCFAGATVKR